MSEKASSVARDERKQITRRGDRLIGDGRYTVEEEVEPAFPVPVDAYSGGCPALRRIARNVKRWKDEKMIRRWVALGIAEAQKGFRRVKSYVSMPSLVAAIRPTAATVAPETKVA